MKNTLLGSVAALTLALPACSPAPSSNTTTSTMNTATSNTTHDSSEGAANKVCLAAVSRETNEDDLAVIHSQFSEAGTLVKIGVGPRRAPWQCIAYANGTTGGVQFLGTEGHSVTAPAPGDISDLANFKGARAGQAEGGLHNLGYTLARTQGLKAYWYNSSRNACAEIVTSQGRYESVTQAALSECGR